MWLNVHELKGAELCVSYLLGWHCTVNPWCKPVSPLGGILNTCPLILTAYYTPLLSSAGASEAAFNRVRDAVRIPMYGE